MIGTIVLVLVQFLLLLLSQLQHLGIDDVLLLATKLRAYLILPPLLALLLLNIRGSC